MQIVKWILFWMRPFGADATEKRSAHTRTQTQTESDCWLCEVMSNSKLTWCPYSSRQCLFHRWFVSLWPLLAFRSWTSTHDSDLATQHTVINHKVFRRQANNSTHAKHGTTIRPRSTRGSFGSFLAMYEGVHSLRACQVSIVGCRIMTGNPKQALAFLYQGSLTQHCQFPYERLLCPLHSLNSSRCKRQSNRKSMTNYRSTLCDKVKTSSLLLQLVQVINRECDVKHCIILWVFGILSTNCTNKGQ